MYSIRRKIRKELNRNVIKRLKARRYILRKRYNRITWKVIHIDIVMCKEALQIASSQNIDITRDEFFEGIINKLAEKEYYPRLAIPLMKKKYKSNRSDSEYYVFLKLEDDLRVKVVVDIRLSDHFSKEHGTVSSYDRHINFMKDKRLKELSDEDSLDISEAEVEYIDTDGQNVFGVNMVRVDGVMFKSYRAGLDAVKDKIEKLP